MTSILSKMCGTTSGNDLESVMFLQEISRNWRRPLKNGTVFHWSLWYCYKLASTLQLKHKPNTYSACWRSWKIKREVQLLILYPVSVSYCYNWILQSRNGSNLILTMIRLSNSFKHFSRLCSYNFRGNSVI